MVKGENTWSPGRRSVRRADQRDSRSRPRTSAGEGRSTEAKHRRIPTRGPPSRTSPRRRRRGRRRSGPAFTKTRSARESLGTLIRPWRKHLRPDQRLRRRFHQLASPDDIRELVVRRGEEARDDQLPHLPRREGRPVLRADLRSRAGLGVLLRQVQGHQAQGHHLRPLRREGHPLAACAASAWATSTWPPRSSTSGSSRPCPAASARCSSMKTTALEKVIYFQDYVVMDPGDTRSSRSSSSPRRVPRGRGSTATPSRRTWAPRRSASCSTASTSRR
jgi:hypothetical protein